MSHSKKSKETNEESPNWLANQLKTLGTKAVGGVGAYALWKVAQEVYNKQLDRQQQQQPRSQQPRQQPPLPALLEFLANPALQPLRAHVLEHQAIPARVWNQLPLAAKVLTRWPNLANEFNLQDLVPAHVLNELHSPPPLERVGRGIRKQGKKRKRKH